MFSASSLRLGEFLMMADVPNLKKHDVLFSVTD